MAYSHTAKYLADRKSSWAFSINLGSNYSGLFWHVHGIAWPGMSSSSFWCNYLEEFSVGCMSWNNIITFTVHLDQAATK